MHNQLGQPATQQFTLNFTGVAMYNRRVTLAVITKRASAH